MHKEQVKIGDYNFGLIRMDTVIIGSGAAGLNTALQLHRGGMENIAILTENWGAGTSNNAGSDKQTYYRLAADGPDGDAVNDMAQALFKGGAMHGDIALIESAVSNQAFMNLVSAGVPFPYDQYGRFPGYITDNDPKGRGTSAGPLTSKLMFEALAAQVVEANIQLLDGYQLIHLLTRSDDEKKIICGAIALNVNSQQSLSPYLVIQANSIVLATGGPGAIYEASVYPVSQHGATGVAIEAGTATCNLTESQFGLASIAFRWNLSGSYQQVIPRYYSIDKQGTERDFLLDYFSSDSNMIEAIFLKGYQWPFDVQKLNNEGSSLIDWLVYRERYLLDRQVFIDYRMNPRLKNNSAFSIELGGKLVLDYLGQSGALGKTPIERLVQLNQPAIDLYRKNGINLYKEALEIDVCAQHCNGGIMGSIWWESSLGNLFCVGEANGSHGVYRPGGSALNSGQVGGIRAAQLILANRQRLMKRQNYLAEQSPSIVDFMDGLRDGTEKVSIDALQSELQQLRHRMSKYAGFVRSAEGIQRARQEAEYQFRQINQMILPTEVDAQVLFFRLREHLFSQMAFLAAIDAYLVQGGHSRGSALLIKENGPIRVPATETEYYELDSEGGYTRTHQLVTTWVNEHFKTDWIAVRPIPESSEWFEDLWKRFRNRDIIKRSAT